MRLPAVRERRPFQCILSYHPLLFPWDLNPRDVPKVEEWFQTAQEVWCRTQHTLTAQSTQMKMQMDRHRRVAPSYHVGQRTWLSTQNLKLPACHKLPTRLIGPFKILQRVGTTSFQLQLLHVDCICPYASPLEPVKYSITYSLTTVTTPPPDTLQDGSSVYKVQALLYSHRRAGHLQYLVDWEGFGPEEPATGILVPHLVTDFHVAHPLKPPPRPPISPRSGRKVLLPFPNMPC